MRDEFFRFADPECLDVYRCVYRARGQTGITPAEALLTGQLIDTSYRRTQPLSACMVRHNDIEVVNADYAPDAHPLREALRWRKEHLLGRTLSRSERRKAQRADRRSRAVVLSV